MLVLLALLIFPHRAEASEESLAEEHARRAKAHIITGHLKDAILEFDLAYRANPLSKYLFNIAELHRRLAMSGSVDELRHSLEYFSKYLQVQPNASDKKLVEDRIIELRAQIESAEAAQSSAEVAPKTAQPTLKAPSSDEPVTTPQLPATTPLKVDEKAKSKRTLGIVLGVVGGVVAVGLGVGLGVGLSQSNAGAPTEPLGMAGLRFQ